MKVVLFCGGKGMRLRDYSDTIPKPLVNVGRRPMLWNLMRYYAHFGHQDFILCLGYRGEAIQDYLLHDGDCESVNIVESRYGKPIARTATNRYGWTVTFVDTGQESCIGERLKSVEEFLTNEEMFLANYCDGMSDLPLNRYIQDVLLMNKVAAFISVAVPHVFHVVEVGDGNRVQSLVPADRSGIRINGGFFVFRKKLFDYIKQGEDLVIEPFQRLIAEDQLIAYPYDGFWCSMDTFKDRQKLEEMEARGETPWLVWKNAKETKC